MRRNPIHRLSERHFEKHSNYLQDNHNGDNIYFDVNIFNNTNTFKNANYNEARVSNILNNPSDYYLAIDKLRIPSDTIPIFIFRDDTYKVSFSFNGTTRTRSVEYIPILNPITPNDRQDVYSYQLFIEMINAVIRDTLIDLQTAIGGPLPVPDPNVSTNPVPQFIYSGENEPISIRFPEEYSKSVVDPTVDFFMNYDLYSFFENFNVEFNGSFTDDASYKIKVYDTGNNYEAISATPSINAYNAFVMTQDAPSFYLWYDFKDVIITSNMLPIGKELLGTADQDGADRTLSILTDIDLSFFGTGESKDIIYIPQPQYRLIDLNSHVELRNIDFQFAFRDRLNNIYQMSLAPKTGLTMKILFIKRSLFNHKG